MEHKIKVSDTDNPKYPMLVTCSCNFQAMCRNQAEADYYKRHHQSNALMIEATKGYQHGH